MSWEIIQQVCYSLNRLLAFLQKEKTYYLVQHDSRMQLLETYKDMENLLNIAADNNYKILDEIPEYEIPSPTDEGLKEEYGAISDKEK